jgi:predicted Zn finger-like uncharacterized protein
MAVEVSCPDCGRAYRLADDKAGKKVRCKNCSAVFPVPTAGKIEDHGERKSEFTPAFGSEDMERLSDHIEEHVGPIEMVFHELISDLVHVDVHWIKATGKRPFHVLVTTGMSDLPMTVPPGAEEHRHAELAIALPADWNMHQAEWQDEDHYWPIRWLKMLARFPHEYETWLADPHTIPNEDPPKRFAPGTAMCGWLISPVFFQEGGIPDCVVSPEKTVKFLGLVPLYKEEMDLKVAHGVEPLLDKFDAAGVDLAVLDPKRPNVCRKRWKFW